MVGRGEVGRKVKEGSKGKGARRARAIERALRGREGQGREKPKMESPRCVWCIR